MYLQIREHAEKAPEQAAVHCLATALSLNQEQDARYSLALYLHIADNVEAEKLQAHVPRGHKTTKKLASNNPEQRRASQQG